MRWSPPRYPRCARWCGTGCWSRSREAGRGAGGRSMVALLHSDRSKATMLGPHRPAQRRVRAVVARVARAAVHVEGATVGEIGPGLLVLLGVHRDDPARGETAEVAAVMARKLHELRIL